MMQVRTWHRFDKDQVYMDLQLFTLSFSGKRKQSFNFSNIRVRGKIQFVIILNTILSNETDDTLTVKQNAALLYWRKIRGEETMCFAYLHRQHFDE